MKRIVVIVGLFFSIFKLNAIAIASNTEIKLDSNANLSIESLFSLPPQDQNGFSILTPSKSSKILYVSSSDGNDQTAKVYSIDSQEIKDIYLPAITIKPFKSIEAAVRVARNNFPDYILLKRGDTFTLSTTLSPKSGLSSQERAVISTYGAEKDRPEVKSISSKYTDVGDAVNLSKTSNFALLGVKFYASDRDPNLIQIDKTLKNRNGFSLVSGGNQVNKLSILIEDCWFDYFSNNVVQAFKAKALTDIVIRRNLITNNFSLSSHSQGLFADRVSMLLEDNVFDHNGWLNQNTGSPFSLGQATMFSHNTYFGEAFDTVFKGNIFVRASSIANKWISNTKDGVNEVKSWNVQIIDNLYIDNEIGISIGGNDTQKNGPRWRNILIKDNVMASLGWSRQTGRDLAWGIDAIDWEGGRIERNIIMNSGRQTSPAVLNSYALNLSGYASDVVINDNKFINIYSNGQPVVKLSDLESSSSKDKGSVNSFNGNLIYSDYEKSGVLLEYSLLKNGEFLNNIFFSAQDKSKWFKFNTKLPSLNDYKNSTNEKTGNISILRNNKIKSIDEFILLKTGAQSSKEYIKMLTKQNRLNWSPETRPANLNKYIREQIYN